MNRKYISPASKITANKANDTSPLPKASDFQPALLLPRCERINSVSNVPLRRIGKTRISTLDMLRGYSCASLSARRRELTEPSSRAEARSLSERPSRNHPIGIFNAKAQRRKEQ